MAGKNNTYAAGILAAIFQAVFTNLQTSGFELAANASTSPATNIYVSLHTADPGASGSQTTSEAGYGSYARVAIARSTGGWTLTGETIENAVAITFPACTSAGTTTGTNTELEGYFGVGLEASGAGQLLYTGALTSALTVGVGITPSFAIDELTITES